MAEQYTLTGLSPREAVADALHRCVLGIDSNDRDLFASGYLQDESASFVADTDTIQGFNAVNEAMSKAFLLNTTHFITNIRVELKDGADTAYMTAHAIAYHVRPDDAFKPEDTSYTAGCLYSIDLVKDTTDGLWKIKTWKAKIQWTTGDIKVLHP
jgi:SnoaL-like domain